MVGLGGGGGGGPRGRVSVSESEGEGSTLSSDSDGDSGSDGDSCSDGAGPSPPDDLLSASGLLEGSFLDSSGGQVSLGDLSWGGGEDVPAGGGGIGIGIGDAAEAGRDRRVRWDGDGGSDGGSEGGGRGASTEVAPGAAASDSDLTATEISPGDSSMHALPSNHTCTETFDTDDSRVASSVDGSGEEEDFGPGTASGGGGGGGGFADHSMSLRLSAMTPVEALRKNAIDQALEETTLYMSKFQDLTASLRTAEKRAASEERRRLQCEARLEEILAEPLPQPLSQPLPAAAAPNAVRVEDAFADQIRSLSEELLQAKGRAESESRRRLDAEARIDELLAQPSRDAADDPPPPSIEIGKCGMNESVLVSPTHDRIPDEEDRADDDDGSTETEESEMLDAREAMESLMERNKTLIKEIRFADQSCVEISERNANLEREVDRLSVALKAATEENGTLLERILKITERSAKAEERGQVLAKQLSVQQASFESQLSNLHSDFVTSRSKMPQQNQAGVPKEVNLIRDSEVYGTEAKDRATCLLGKLERTEIERDALRLKCAELEAELMLIKEEIGSNERRTPQKPKLVNSSAPNQTPTSIILAKTLQSEIERGHSASDRAHEAEKQMISLQMSLRTSHKDASTANDKISALEKQLKANHTEDEKLDVANDGNRRGVDDDSSGVVKLRTQLHDVLNDNKALMAKMSKKDRKEDESNEATKLRGQLHDILIENKALASKLLILGNSKDNESSEISQLHSKLNNITNENKELVSEVISLKAKVSVGNDSREMASLRSKLHDIIYENKALLIEVATQKATVEDIENQFQAEVAESLELESQLESQSLSTTDENASLLTASDEGFASHDRGNEVSGVAKTPGTELSDLVMNATFGRDETRLSRDTSIQLLEEARSHQAQDPPSERAISNPEDELHKRIDELERELAEQDERSDKYTESLLAQITHLHSQLDGAHNQLEEAKAEVIQARKEAAEMLNKLGIENDSLSEEKRSLMAKLSDLKAELDIVLTSSDLNGTKASIIEEGEKAVGEEHAESSGAAISTHTTLSNLRAELSVKISEIQRLDNMCKEQMDMIEKYKCLRIEDAQVVEDLRERLENMEAKTEMTKHSLIDGNTKLALSTERNSAMRSKIEDLQMESSRTKMMLESTVKDLTDAKSRILTTEKENAGLQSALEHRDVDIHALQDELSSAKEATHRISIEKKAEINELDATCSRAEAALQKSQSSLNAMERALTSTVADCEKFKSVQKKNEEELRLLVQDLEDERDYAVEALRQKEHSLVDTIVRQKAEFSHTHEKLVTAHGEIESLQTKKSALDMKCSKLREYVKDLTNKCEEWSKSYRKQSTELVTAQKDSVELEEKLSQMRSLLVGQGESRFSEARDELKSVISTQSQVRSNLLSHEKERGESRFIKWGIREHGILSPKYIV